MNIKKIKGFTLIELLAVIVILAIIAAIAIPIVINIIKETKVSSIKRSSELYIDAVELTLANAKIDNIDITQCKVEKENLVCNDKKYKIEINGNHPEEVEIKATKKGEIYFAMQSEGYCVLKTEEEKTTKYKKLVDNVTNHDVEADYNSCSLTPIYTTTKNCFEFDSITGTITNYYTYENNDKTQSKCTKKVIIPRKIDGVEVKIIGTSAFQWDLIEEVVLPDTVEIIKSTAFRYNNLEEVIIPEGVTTIEGAAFANNKIKKYTLPTTLVNFSSSAFKLNELPPESAFFYKRNEDGSFDYSTIVGYGGKEKNIEIPSEKNGVKLTTIDSNAFTWDVLTGVEIPNTVTTIKASAFRYNDIKELVIPGNVKVIESSAFGNNKIEKLEILEGVEKIGSYAFSNNLLKEFDIPSTVKTKENFIFKYNKLPQETAYIYKENEDGTIDYSTIDYYAGEDLNIIIPEEKNGVKLTTIGKDAFAWYGLTSVEIPSTVTLIEQNAFYSNSNLKSIIIKNLKENVTLSFRSFDSTDLISWEPIEE